MLSFTLLLYLVSRLAAFLEQTKERYALLRTALVCKNGISGGRDALVTTIVGVQRKSRQEVRPLLGGYTSNCCCFQNEVTVAQ
jgi:hypothetical protein